MRVDPDSRAVGWLSLALVAVLAAASFTISFLGLMEAAEWAGVPMHLRWLVPVVVDSTLLVYALAATVQRSRGESDRMSWVAVGFFTAVSVAANAAHVVAPGGVLQPLSGAVIFGGLIAAVMPVSLMLATHTAVSLAVAPVHGSVAQRRKRAAALVVGRAEAPAPEGRKSGKSVPRKSVSPEEVLRLAEQERLSQRAIADRLGTSKTTVARIMELAGA